MSVRSSARPLAGLALACMLTQTAAHAADAPVATPLRGWRADLVHPTHVALDADDNLFVADPLAPAVVVRAPDGLLLDRYEGASLPSCVGFDVDGNVLVCDAADGSVRAYDLDWNELYALGQGEDELVLPGDVATDPVTGRVYVSDTWAGHVAVYDVDGSWIEDLDAADLGGLSSPTGLFLDADFGELYVVDRYYRVVRVIGVDGVGRRSFATYGSDPGRVLEPRGVWVDALSRVYVADARYGAVRVFTSTGTSLGTIGQFGEQRGRLRVPQDLAMDGAGRLFVASTDNARVEVYGIDDWSDPEAWISVEAVLLTDTILRGSAGESLDVLIEAAGYRSSDIDVHGLAGMAPISIEDGEHDGDFIQDVLATFSVDELLLTLTDGTHDLEVTGTVDGLAFEEVLTLTVTTPPPVDTGDSDDTGDSGSGDSGDAGDTGDSGTPPCSGADLVVSCNIGAQVTPASVPQSFTATATGGCSPTVSIGATDCWAINGAQKRIDRTSACKLAVSDAELRIDITGGVGTIIAWTATAASADGVSASQSCQVEVANPGGGK